MSAITPQLALQQLVVPAQIQIQTESHPSVATALQKCLVCLSSSNTFGLRAYYYLVLSLRSLHLQELSRKLDDLKSTSRAYLGLVHHHISAGRFKSAASNADLGQLLSGFVVSTPLIRLTVTDVYFATLRCSLGHHSQSQRH